MIAAVLSIASVPVMLLNFFGGIVGGVWLLVLGKWGLLGLGIISMLISSFFLGFILMIGMIFDAPGAIALGKGKFAIGVGLLLLGNIWTFLVMTVWCVGSFDVVLGYYREGSIWPTYCGPTGWPQVRGRTWPLERGQMHRHLP